MLDVYKLANGYFHYLQETTQIEKIDKNTFEIITPFLDRHNDHISIYVEIKGDDKIRLSDDGYTIEDLNMSGFDFSTPKKQNELNIILNGYGILRNDSELFLETNSTNFAKKQHNLIQSLISVNDMFVLAKDKVSTFFFEDVALFFDKYDIRYISNLSFEGKTHFTHKFDFAITKSKTHKERLIKLLNTPKKDNLKATIFSFIDLQDEKLSNIDKVLIFNDNDNSSKDIMQATEEYNIKPIAWSDRKTYIDYLVA